MQIEDEPRQGRPVTKTSLENIELIRRLIDEDPHCTIDDLEVETLLSHGTIDRIIQDHPMKRKVTSRWVPHNLTAEQKDLRVKMCKENLKKLESGTWRLCDIITGDECWIYQRQIGRKISNACWLDEGESPGTVVRREKHEPKTLFSLSFKSDGALLVHRVGEGDKVDHSHYINQILKPVVRELQIERPNSGTHGIKILHDNSKAHDAVEVHNFLADEKITIMPHPPYPPDLPPSDYWLNDFVKRNLTDQKNESSLFKAVTKIVFNIPRQEYKKAFNKLIERMKLCIKNNGDYFKHLVEQWSHLSPVCV